MKSKATLKQIAKELGVSVSTVSKALNGSPEISEPTKQRVQEYADMLRVSRVTLNNSVMAQFGVSAIHLLKQRLLEELKNELLFSDRNVSQLADEFHFSDPSHLMRFFKQQTGKTFTQYITDYQNGIYE